MRDLFLGMKFFDCIEHLEDFMNGKIYFTTSGALLNGNNSEINYNEFAIPVFTHEIKINGHPIPCASYSLFYEWQKQIPLFCFCLLDSTNFEYKAEEDISVISIPKQFPLKANKKFAVIFDISDFLNRLEPISNQQQFGFKTIKTKYFDFDKKDDAWLSVVQNDTYGFLEIHSNNHSYQNEMRVILTNMLREAPFLLDIGAWRSIPIKLQFHKQKWEVFT